VGEVRDERTQYIPQDFTRHFFSLVNRHTPLVFEQNTELMNEKGQVVGCGDHATVALWDGEKVNGYITVDNLMSQRPIDEMHKEALILYAQVIGHLIKLKKTEQDLRNLNLELENRVKLRTIELEASNHEMQSFSYSISHDLRAPLRTLNSFCQILMDDYSEKLDEQGKNYLGRIQSASQHMANLMDALLKLTRISRSELQMVPVNLSAVAEDVLKNLQTNQPDRQVEWVIQPDLKCCGDPTLMRLMLDNLLGNAWKFTVYRPDARIELGETRHNGQRAIYVRDNGAGFDMKYSDKLFGAFQRLHSAAEFEGTGIGLAIVQRIIRRHGGEIWAEAAVENGATFYFTVPDAL
jgi:light-regulated signal transduction histidine kinase (bacteriophytochrome)